MKIIESYITKNVIYQRNLRKTDNRYKTFQTRGPLGLMIHSVGVPQPKASVFVKNFNIPNYETSVHAFVEPDVVYQTLPWSFRGTHAGGNANNTHIGVELTEPATIKYTGGATYIDNNPTKTGEHVRATYKTAVELFAMLCKQYKLDPLKDGVIISHSEGHKRGIASNHSDVEHLWNKFGLTMNQFRKDIKAAMAGDPVQETVKPETPREPVKPIAPKEEKIPALYESLDVNDIVYHDGGMQYSSASATKGSAVKASKVKVTHKYKENSKHPIHVRSVDDSGKFIPGIYGWVDLSDLYMSSTEPYLVKVTANALNYRSGPGTSYPVLGVIRDKGVYTIVQEKDGWGQLSSTVGWIKLSYTKKV